MCVRRRRRSRRTKGGEIFARQVVVQRKSHLVRQFRRTRSTRHARAYIINNSSDWKQRNALYELHTYVRALCIGARVKEIDVYGTDD